MQQKEQNLNNRSSHTDFLLLGFSEVHELQVLLFFVFLAYYLVAVGVNLLIISAVATDCHLHKPMYFLLMNLAIQDVGQVSVIFPKSMGNSLMGIRHISYSGCVAQVFFYIFFAVSDIFLLTVMAYDRYVAICNPLQYEALMNMHVCLQMIVIVWISSFLYGILHACGTFAAPFCSNTVNQFFCEIPQLMILTCSNLYLIEFGLLILSGVAIVGCFIAITVTYVHILSAVLKIPSGQRRQKAFSTCFPHLIVVFLFVATVCSVYIKPTSHSPSHYDMAMTILYSMVPPLMNPIIYSLRNTEIKKAVSNFLVSEYYSVLFAFHCNTRS